MHSGGWQNCGESRGGARRGGVSPNLRDGEPRTTPKGGVRNRRSKIHSARWRNGSVVEARIRHETQRRGGQSPGCAKRQGSSDSQCKRMLATLTHMPPPGHFFVLAIWPSGANKPQSSIGFQKSLTLEASSENGVSDKMRPRDLPAPPTSTNGNPFGQSSRRIHYRPFGPNPGAKASVFGAWGCPLGARHYAWRSYSWTPAVSM